MLLLYMYEMIVTLYLEANPIIRREVVFVVEISYNLSQRKHITFYWKQIESFGGKLYSSRFRIIYFRGSILCFIGNRSNRSEGSFIPRDFWRVVSTLIVSVHRYISQSIINCLKWPKHQKLQSEKRLRTTSLFCQ